MSSSMFVQGYSEPSQVSARGKTCMRNLSKEIPTTYKTSLPKMAQNAV